MRRATTLVGLVAVLATAACGGAQDSAEPELDPAKLTIYSSQHENVTQAWVDAFEKKTGEEVQIRFGKDSSMGHQLVEEGADSPADVFLTENSPAMTLVQDADLLAPVDDTTLAQVPKDRAPSNGLWTSIAARSTVLVYNPELVDEADLPDSLMDLQDPEYQGKWGAGATGADFQAIVAGMLELEGEQATADWLTGLKDNAELLQNNIVTMKAVNEGQLPMGVIYHYYWYRDQAASKEGSGNTKLKYFKNEDPGAFVSYSAGGVLKSSKHSAEAQDFLAFVTSKEGQQILTDSGAKEYTVATGVEADADLPPLDSLEAPDIDPFTLDSEKVAELMTDAGVL
ncbi:extracellular solute-binding protein [Janibacter sp. G1551]|uniref:extracellular solute-binding protein n=1 Tax=Janibacter sp. G1551 TaxID=3420440 RepID=UPI003CFE0623